MTKRCPFCAEEILVEAVKCKHCGSMLVEAPQIPTPVVIQQPPKKGLGWLGWLLLLLAVGVIASALGLSTSERTATKQEQRKRFAQLMSEQLEHDFHVADSVWTRGPDDTELVFDVFGCDDAALRKFRDAAKGAHEMGFLKFACRVGDWILVVP